MRSGAYDTLGGRSSRPCPRPILYEDRLVQRLLAVSREDGRCAQNCVCGINGTYEFLRMPFGLVNSAATLVRRLRKLLKGLEYANHYMDDIVIHTYVEKTRCRSQESTKEDYPARLTIRPSKCVVGARTLSFIGHKIRHGLIHPSKENFLKN